MIDVDETGDGSGLVMKRFLNLDWECKIGSATCVGRLSECFRSGLTQPVWGHVM